MICSTATPPDLGVAPLALPESLHLIPDFRDYPHSPGGLHLNFHRVSRDCREFGLMRMALTHPSSYFDPRTLHLSSFPSPRSLGGIDLLRFKFHAWDGCVKTKNSHPSWIRTGTGISTVLLCYCVLYYSVVRYCTVP